MLEALPEVGGFRLRSVPTDEGPVFPPVQWRWNASGDGWKEWGIVEALLVDAGGLFVMTPGDPTSVSVAPIRNRTIAPLADVPRFKPAGAYVFSACVWTPPGAELCDEFSFSVGEGASWKNELFCTALAEEKSVEFAVGRPWEWVETRKIRGSSGSRIVALTAERADGIRFGLAAGCSKAFHRGLFHGDGGSLEFRSEAEPWSYFRSYLVQR